MRRSHFSSSFLVTSLLGGAALGATAVAGCGADVDDIFGNAGSSAGAPTGGAGGSGGATSSASGGGEATTTSGTGGAGGGETTTTSSSGGGGDPTTSSSSGGPTSSSSSSSGAGGGPVGACDGECGPVERCDPGHLGLDDNCNGLVDEVCTCVAGRAHSCFMGDPGYRGAAGCFDGTERCTESGTWGPCLGGAHATEACFAASTAGCHAIEALPYGEVNLKDGTGTFSADAAPGMESWTVTCPAGVNPCPSVRGASPQDDFKPLHSGEYTVTYHKTLNDGSASSCTYPLVIGARGLRIELDWEHDLGNGGVDIDLHVHKPNDTSPWATSGSPVDCGYSNCAATDFSTGGGFPEWFSASATPPDPVNWYLDPVFTNNVCYFAPRAAGAAWQSQGRGCHSPRLETDNITCSPTVTDPASADFCVPENVGIDFPPIGEWTRIGVHYYSAHGVAYDVHPRVQVFCDGALAADLGPSGYFSPEHPVTFAPSNEGVFWLVADVAFIEGACGTPCVVSPLRAAGDPSAPLITTRAAVESSFAPPYPPAP